ncbi:hypothetical protein SAMN04515674_101378 [Pseudarcicella hirudinis]|uniref:Uncharacterized protein n=1 Tax=Pseudarcicella hirudinis TaxID=1079859 RepID=A0A1I5MN04_9BACT|nr:hypothetical protein [Pseudarcicella hirudinis]SFP10994.1 hypothetical protein SAMN04515674_101378 [Pseudarcicella hirudinis]
MKTKTAVSLIVLVASMTILAILLVPGKIPQISSAGFLLIISVMTFANFSKKEHHK